MNRHPQKGLMEALSSLERKYPGSVHIDKDGVVTLTGWKSEQFNNASDEKIDHSHEIKYQQEKCNEREINPDHH